MGITAVAAMAAANPTSSPLFAAATVVGMVGGTAGTIAVGAEPIARADRPHGQHRMDQVGVMAA